MAPNGSQRLPTAPYDYKHTLLLFSSSMTPTDLHLLPPRELTPQPYSKDKDAVTSLMSAASQGNLEVCKMLIDVGVEVDAVANSGGTALMFAAGAGYAEVSRHAEVNI